MNRNIFIIAFVTFAAILFSGCPPEGGDAGYSCIDGKCEADFENPQYSSLADCKSDCGNGGGGKEWIHGTSGYDIYLCGRNSEGYATYWKNGVAYVNKNHKNDYFGIAVAGSDVYTISAPYYFKNNGAGMTLAGTMPLPFHIAVGSGGVAHVVGGNSTTSSAYWKNGVATPLPATFIPSTNYGNSCVTVSGNDVYIAGTSVQSGGGTAAAYWKNGTVHHVGARSTDVSTSAFSVFVSGNDIYLAGSKQAYSWLYGFTHAACYWKNNTEVILPGNAREATNIIVSSNGDVHVIGNETAAWQNPNGTYGGTSKAYYWKNGVISMPAMAGYAASFAVAGNDVYIIIDAFGNNPEEPSYLLKNGQKIAFERGAHIIDIVAVPKGK